MSKDRTLLVPQGLKGNPGFLFKSLLRFDPCCSGSQPKESRTKSELIHSTQMTRLYFLSALFHLLPGRGQRQGRGRRLAHGGCSAAGGQSRSPTATRWQPAPAAGAPAAASPAAGASPSCRLPPPRGQTPARSHPHGGQLNDGRGVLSGGG